MTNYVTPEEAAKIFNVSQQTLRRWATEGRIKFNVTDGGHRRYQVQLDNKKGFSIIYARVSSRKQSEDLERQIKYLKEKYPEHTVIKDIGSGINFRRTGFNEILDELFDGNIKEVVVSSEDRFSRFGFELFENIFKRFGAKLICVDEQTVKSSQEELAEDLLAIITVFTAKYHGKRKYTLHKEDKNISNRRPKKVLS